jgi:hypothetical protein
MARYLIDANLPRYASVWVGVDCEFVLDSRDTGRA